MKKLAIAAAMMLLGANAYAACTSHTYIVNGKTVTCMTCCYGEGQFRTCTTTCN